MESQIAVCWHFNCLLLRYIILLKSQSAHMNRMDSDFGLEFLKHGSAKFCQFYQKALEKNWF